MKTLDVQKLVNLIAEGIRVLRSRDGVPLTDKICHERARNIAASVIGAYELRELPGPYTVDFDTSLIAGRPVGHGWSCKCTACDTYKRSVPRAPTDKQPYTARCEQFCANGCGRLCSKANGHEWSCFCHYSTCKGVTEGAKR